MIRDERDLTDAARLHPERPLAISADKDAPWGRVVNVRDAAKAANIQSVSAFVRTGAGP